MGGRLYKKTVKRGTTEYQLSLVIDNFLNIKRRQLKK